MVYTNVSEDQVNGLVTELQKQGASVTPLTGGWEVTGHGVTSQALYDRNEQVLTVKIVHKPFWMPESIIEDGIGKALGR